MSSHLRPGEYSHTDVTHLASGALEVTTVCKSTPAVAISGSFWNADVFIGRVPVIKTLALTNIVTLAVALFA